MYNYSMKIGIAGYGMVGRAHHELLKDRHDVVINDPGLDMHASFEDVDAVIVCVSTPPHDTGACNINNVYEVIEASPNVPILIKSTISVEGWDMLVESFPNRRIAFSPEFLRAASAVEDLQNMKLMLIGGTSCTGWRDVFNINVEVADARELILAKYARNSFLALKVAFFNQMYDLCDALDIEYSAVAHYTTMDERIGDSHSFITEERGFGGHCFPKDTQAITTTARRNNVTLSILEEAINYNNQLRKRTN
jgi:UDPglucose 6-dehydrogenase